MTASSQHSLGVSGVLDWSFLGFLLFDEKLCSKNGSVGSKVQVLVPRSQSPSESWCPAASQHNIWTRHCTVHLLIIGDRNYIYDVLTLE